MKSKKENKQKGKKIYLCLMIFFIVLTIGSLGIWTYQEWQKSKAIRAYDELQNMVNDVSVSEDYIADTSVVDAQVAAVVTDGGETEITTNEDTYIVPAKSIDWNELYNINGHIYSWISVSGTTIDYPVLQHDTIRLFYLKHNLDGSFGFPGCIFTEYYNSKDYSDPVTVLYGHRMENKTMFTTLHNFDDPDYFDGDNYYVYIYTPDYTFVYQLFAALEFRSVDILENYDFSNEYVYTEFLRDINEYDGGRVKNIREDIEVTNEDQVIVLSTCTLDSRYDLRAIYVAKLLNPKED